MVSDPRIGVIIGGLILTVVGITIPTEFDIANEMKDELKSIIDDCAFGIERINDMIKQK